jgi:putative DNA primase/helicase
MSNNHIENQGHEESVQYFDQVDVHQYIDQVLNFLLRNENGDAEILIKELNGKVAFCHQTNEVYIFKDHFWVKDANNAILSCADVVAEHYQKIADKIVNYRNLSFMNNDNNGAKLCDDALKSIKKRIATVNSVKRRKNIIEMASSGSKSLAINIKNFDKNPMLLCCKNGVIDLKTGEIRDGRPDDYITIAAPTYWEGLEKECPVWERFMLDIFDNDQEIVSFVQRMLGYSITGLTTEHYFCILVGKGRNGKSTTFETVADILGPFAKPFSHELLHELNFSRSSASPSPDILNLRGTRLTWCSETEENKRLNAAKIKRLTGGDKLSARAIYGKDIVSFDPTHKLMLLCNAVPTIDVDDYAFNKRLIIVNYPLSFVQKPIEDFERKADALLKETLKDEKPGILAWLVRGCLEWQKNGLAIPSKIQNETEQLLFDENIIVNFLTEVCNSNPDNRVQGSVIYATYKNWSENNGFKPFNIVNFGKKLTKIHEKKRINGQIFYTGISIKPEYDHLTSCPE